MKKLISLVLALMMVLGSCPLSLLMICPSTWSSLIW